MINNEIQKQAQAEGNLASDPDMQIHIETDKEWLDELEERYEGWSLNNPTICQDCGGYLDKDESDRLIDMARKVDEKPSVETKVLSYVLEKTQIKLVRYEKALRDIESNDDIYISDIVKIASSALEDKE